MQLFLNTSCSHIRMQVLPYEYFYTSMGFHSFGCVPTCFAFYKRTFKVDFLARVEDRGRKSTSKSAPAAKPPPFEHPSFRCFQYLVVEDATDPGFTFDKRLVCVHCETIWGWRSRQENRDDGWTCSLSKLLLPRYSIDLEATPDTPVEAFQEPKHTSSSCVDIKHVRRLPSPSLSILWSAGLQ